MVSGPACSRPALPGSRPPADDRVTQLADSYLAAYFDRYPGQTTIYGIPSRPHNRLPANSLESLREWQAKEDTWLAELNTVEGAPISNPSLRATYAILREALEGLIETRICRSELWNVSHMTGWHVQFGYLATVQPVGDAGRRADAMARWTMLPPFIEVEIENLREGLRYGYSAPKQNVAIVIRQVSALLSGPDNDSPFLSPALRDAEPGFKRGYTALVRTQIVPAIARYRDFLQREYLPAARQSVAVSELPDGRTCYAAAVRQHSSLRVPPERVHATGLAEVDRLEAEMRVIAETSFGTGDVAAVLQRVRSDHRYLFRSRRQLVAYSEAALARAMAAAPRWFNLSPRASVRIEPYPRYRERNAPNEYNPPAEDGSRPGLFYISAYQAERKSRATAESTAFHETIPGHHVQVAIALERQANHPIGRDIFNSGYVEGWGLYAERLADEMQLFSSDLDRLGMLSSQAFRASRLVVDAGLHTLGWSRQRAIDYLLAHTAEEATDAASEVDRYIIYPGQATGYLLGMLEIQQARAEAQRALGSAFDIKAFHDRVLEDGGVPLAYLKTKIAGWAAAGGGNSPPARYSPLPLN